MKTLMMVIALMLGLAGPASAAVAANNYQGLWWNAGESGWGINFSHQGDIIFATWFTYDVQGKPWWLIAELHKTGDGIYSGPVATVTGPSFNAVPFPPGGSPGGAVETTVGSMTTTFADTGHATITYTVNGTSQTKSIVPQQFGPLPICAWGVQPNLALATNFTDLWWNAGESGWGVNFTHQGDIIFATWFTYDAQRQPWWLIAELRRTGDRIYSGPVATVTGPSFNAVPFPPGGSPGGAVESPAGTATLTIADGNGAALAYTVNGVSQTKQITRQVFVPPGTTCSVPTATAVGTATGGVAGKTIGVSGGSASAPDGKFVLTIPAGALAGDTAIGIQPLTNMAHGKIGAAYRLTPEGQTFLKPVKLSFAYTDQDLLGTAAEVLGAAFQTADGFWQWAGDAVIDTAAKTVSVSSGHLSDWSMVRGLQIRPASKTVKVNARVGMKVAFCFDPDPVPGSNGELVSLGYDCDAGEELAFLNPVGEWSVNGVLGGSAVTGTVSGSGPVATYAAPATKPSPATVAVSARVDRGPRGRTLVVSNITVEDDSWTGTGSSESAGISATAQVTWTLESTTNNVATYKPTGTASVVVHGCMSYAPSSGTLDRDSGVLVVDYNTTPPTYHGTGLTQWPTIATVTCPQPPPPFSTFAVAAFFGGSKGTDGVEAQGAVSPDGVTIEGSDTNVSGPEPVTFNWKFTRNE